MSSKQLVISDYECLSSKEKVFLYSAGVKI